MCFSASCKNADSHKEFHKEFSSMDLFFVKKYDDFSCYTFLNTGLNSRLNTTVTSG